MDPYLDRAPGGYLAFDDEGRIAAANTTLAERLGYPRDELVGQHVERLLTIGGRIFYQTHFFPLVRMHGHAQEVFMLLRAQDGSDVGSLWNAVRREHEGTWITECVIMEVHERRKFEEALIQARQAAEQALDELQRRTSELERVNYQLEEQAVELELQQQQLEEQAAEMEAQARTLADVNEDLEHERAAAQEANQAKSSFLAVMSHELRTPLNAIGGYGQLLEMEVKGPLNADQREYLRRINRSQRHLLGLINDVLNLSRIEAGRVEYHLEPMRAADVVLNVTPMVEPQAAAKELRLHVDVPADIVVRADRDKLQQILINLLTNAVKFTGNGGTVTVRAVRDDMAAATARISVQDTGVGIPAPMVDRVFEPFVQVDSSRTRSSEGTGLGLAISRDLARGMGGDLVAASTLGQGSTFTIVVPLDGSREAGHRAPASTLDAAATEVMQG